MSEVMPPQPPKTVECDDECGALENPVTLDELRAAYEHWRRHPYAFGCSHGC